MSARTYSKKTKASALAALLTGERPAVVARAFGVPEGTVRSWKHRLKTGGVATLKKGELDEMLFEYLEATLRSLVAEASHLVEGDRFREMRADELGIFFGVLFDRTFRMLEMWESVWGPIFDQKEER